MTTSRPDWTDALANVLTGLAQQAPRPLLAAVAFFTGQDVSGEALAAFLLAIDENDPVLTRLRLAMAHWDQAGPGSWADKITPGARQSRTSGRRQWVLGELGLNNAVAARINELAPVYEEPATVISQIFEPWYPAARAARSQMYWTHYEEALRQKHWDAEAITALDETTTEVIERLSDPTRPEARQTKGLVVGYVQSGKTANFTGVAAKAIDAGYRLVIVLTGTIELLRAQTQRRLDMELVGRENIAAGQDMTDPQVLKEFDYREDEDWIAGRFVEHGLDMDQPGVPHVRRVTTHTSDYKRLPQGLTQLRFARIDKSKPFNDPINLYPSDAYIAVVKKNKASLTKLTKDLKPLQHAIADLPILIIDDESDQASVNTVNPKSWTAAGGPEAIKRTAINGLISGLVKLCPRAQYVGYTATPFANVFIDPDDTIDLFPSNFLLALRPPPEYMGVGAFHDVGKSWDDYDPTVATSNRLAHVRALEGDPTPGSPERDRELAGALDAFVLSGALKLYRQAVSSRRFKHHTMLVHESVKQNDHRETADAVRRLWALGAYTSPEAADRLEKLWNDDFGPVCMARASGEAIPSTFSELTSYIGECNALIMKDADPVIVVNSDSDVQQKQKQLDFETEAVWRILVGGAQLSRGFTVQDLTISYFRRKTGSGDTLMQAGRWFGFRPGYRDLVRLYIRRDHELDLYAAFEALLMDEEAFRQELRQFEGLDEDGRPQLEPRQIPPLVSQHLPWLRPTSRTKMWNAVVDEKAVGGQVSDLFNHPERENVRAKTHNLNNVGLPLLRAATDTVRMRFGPRQNPGDFEAKVGTLSAARVLELLAPVTGMRWHPTFSDPMTDHSKEPAYVDKFKPTLKYLAEATKAKRIEDWVIVWPQPSKAELWRSVDGLDAEAPVIQRTRRDGRTDFVGSDSKHRDPVGRLAGAVVSNSPDDPEVERLRRPTRGAILVYLVDDTPDPAADSSISDLSVSSNLLVLFSLAVPSSAVPASGGVIRWVVHQSGHGGGAPVSVLINPVHA